MDRFTGKVVVITGGASGIGLATAKRVFGEGARVVLVDLDREALGRARAEMGGGDRVAVFAADVSDATQVRDYVQFVLDTFGRIDGFFNNAGIEGRQWPTAEYDLDEYNRVLAVNLNGVFYGLVEVLKVMERQGSGSIVNCSSAAGIRGVLNHAGYSASKHGVIGLTRNAAIEYGQYGIQVNAIAPGGIVTPMMESSLENAIGENWREVAPSLAEMNPMRRMGEPEEVAALTAFLLSGEAMYVNGATIPIDGGQSAQF